MTTLTFTSKKLCDTTVVGPDRRVWYTTETTRGLRGRKVTAIRAASGATGKIDWREKTFAINGEQRTLKQLRTGGFLGQWRGVKWRWAATSYSAKFKHFQKEIWVTPDGMGSGTARFTAYEPHLFGKNDNATILFPLDMQNELERVFVLMIMLQTEMHKQDTRKSAEAADLAVSATS
ncbi:hypothetical protein MKEN_00958100 [Mycena kentingensis (nom. inval.)]|nr:hypothetical protein MKEN_00958100 [Mycena kentingensis (nom. inval.)]